jgi:cell division protein FtsI (penicillin-binding protein 3)
MSFVLESKHIPPTGTKIIPIALTEKALVKARANENEATNSASGSL